MTELKTKRLILRKYEAGDKKEFEKLFTDAGVMKHVDTGALTAEKADALWRKLLEDFYPHGKDTIYAVIVAADDRYIGHAAIRPRPTKPEDWEISYILKEEEWGKGFATEIARRLVAFGFEDLKLPAVFATIDDDNFDSIKVAEKAGLKFLRHEYDDEGRFSLFAIERERFAV